ncbi:MAG: hypothetical protein KO206_05345 [Methanomicrobiaceae archaeon]|nr:hypothetical protein [Methanomicrobiaceae archaeon]MDD5418749.1 hypothetical protein [Methanomicrobiaceae archaeon]
MTQKTFEISAYEIQLAKEKRIVCEGRAVAVQAIIRCIGIPSIYSDEHWRVHLYFAGDAAGLPGTAVSQEDRLIRVFLPDGHFERFVDLLRNEKPIFCNFDFDRPDEIIFRSSIEPVGEEESSG